MHHLQYLAGRMPSHRGKIPQFIHPIENLQPPRDRGFRTE